MQRKQDEQYKVKVSKLHKKEAAERTWVSLSYRIVRNKPKLMVELHN